MNCNLNNNNDKKICDIFDSIFASIENVNQNFDNHVNIRINDSFQFKIPEPFSIPDILAEIGVILKKVTESYDVSVYIVDSETNEMFMSSHKDNDAISERIRHQKIVSGTTIAAYVALKKEYALVNALEIDDEKYPLVIGRSDIIVTTVLCVPVVTPDGTCFAVFEAVRIDRTEYQNNHLQIVVTIMGWLGATYDQYNKRKYLKSEQELNDNLLRLTNDYFSKGISEVTLILKFLDSLKNEIKAERGSVYAIRDLADPFEVDVYDEVFENHIVQIKFKPKLKLKKSHGFASMCVQKKEVLNIIDARNRKDIDSDFDQKPKMRTESVICLPVSDKKSLLGVIQLFNKVGGKYFTKNDEEIFQKFSIYFSLLLHGIQMDRKIIKYHKFNDTCREMLSNEMNQSYYSVDEFTDIEPPSDFISFSWHPYPQYLNKLKELAYYIFQKSVQEKYFDAYRFKFMINNIVHSQRNNVYHNFEYAFNVLHCLFCIFELGKHEFNEFEKIGMLLAGLTHSIQHLGYTNEFLKATKHPLSVLYEDSNLQNYNFWLSLKILTFEDHSIFDKFDIYEYKNVVRYLEEGILATDLDYSLAYQKKLGFLFKNNNFFWINGEHIFYLRNLIMRCATLSIYGKPYEVAKRSIVNLLREYFIEGDKLKSFGLPVKSLYNKAKKKEYPENQIQILQKICIPQFDLLKDILNIPDLYIAAKELLKLLEEMCEIRGAKTWYPDENIRKLFDFSSE